MVFSSLSSLLFSQVVLTRKVEVLELGSAFRLEGLFSSVVFFVQVLEVEVVVSTEDCHEVQGVFPREDHPPEGVFSEEMDSKVTVFSEEVDSKVTVFSSFEGADLTATVFSEEADSTVKVFSEEADSTVKVSNPKDEVREATVFSEEVVC